MTLKLGSTNISALRLGGTEITQARLGSTLVWAKTNVRDDFNRADQIGLGANWTDHGDATGDYRAAIAQGSYARINIPDVIFDLGQDLKVSRWRYSSAVLPGDNGYVEARIANAGDQTKANIITRVYARLSNGGFTHGVGFQLDSGVCRIVRMVGGTETVMASGGSYASGDIVRLEFNGQVFSLRRNGSLVAGWTDTGTSSSGSGFRSMGVLFSGSKDVWGPRRYSAALDYVEAG